MPFFSRFRFGTFLALAGGLFALMPSPARAAATEAAHAVDTATPPVTVDGAWARWLPEGLPAAGYMILHNSHKTDAVLTGVSSIDFKRVQLHQSYARPGGEMGMRGIKTLTVPAGGITSLQPGGYHLMLMDARRSLKPGDTITVTLHFKDAPDVTVSLPLKPAGAQE